MKRCLLSSLILIIICCVLSCSACAEVSYDSLLELASDLRHKEITHQSIEAFALALDEFEGMTMQIGSRGLEIEAFQDLLVLSGYLTEHYIPGLYGSSTAQAVESFQSVCELPITGKASLATQFMLIVTAADFQYDESDRLFAIANNFGIVVYPDNTFFIGYFEQNGINPAKGTAYPPEDNEKSEMDIAVDNSANSGSLQVETETDVCTPRAYYREIDRDKDTYYKQSITLENNLEIRITTTLYHKTSKFEGGRITGSFPVSPASSYYSVEWITKYEHCIVNNRYDITFSDTGAFITILEGNDDYHIEGFFPIDSN